MSALVAYRPILRGKPLRSLGRGLDGTRHWVSGGAAPREPMPRRSQPGLVMAGRAGAQLSFANARAARAPCTPLRCGRSGRYRGEVARIVPTFSQLVRKGRKAPKYKTSSPALQKCPQKRGVCTRVYTVTPKKPNSALRKVARVRLTTASKSPPTSPRRPQPAGALDRAHSRRAASRTCPAFAITWCAGRLDASGVEDRRQARSKYGAKRPKK